MAQREHSSDQQCVAQILNCVQALFCGKCGKRHHEQLSPAPRRKQETKTRRARAKVFSCQTTTVNTTPTLFCSSGEMLHALTVLALDEYETRSSSRSKNETWCR